jgi:oxygen-independent coproporphyrinogen-3 oxidase
VTAAYACWAAARRVRISLGVQSFAARLRETLGRRATADPMAAAMRVREAGLEDLSIDLIFGIPGQTRADLEDDVAAVASLGPDHVSWYELEVVPGRLLAVRMTSQGGMAPGDDDVGGGRERGLPQDRDDYRFIVSALESLGYRWYETSNFALPRQRSRHNAAGWRGRDYLGLGPAAVSTVGDDRWRNVDDVAAYVAFWGGSGADAPEPPPRTHEHLDPVTRARERLMLAGRTGAAVPLAELDAALDRDAAAVLAAAGFVSLRGGTLRLTRKGRHVANDVCVRLFRVVSF